MFGGISQAILPRILNLRLDILPVNRDLEVRLSYVNAFCIIVIEIINGVVILAYYTQFEIEKRSFKRPLYKYFVASLEYASHKEFHKP